YSEKDLDDILTVQQDAITEIQMIDLSGQMRYTKDSEQITSILHYFNQFQYKRLRNDQTAFMPDHTMMIHLYSGDEHDFIIPYGDEAMVSHKVYSIKNGVIKQDELLQIFQSLTEKEQTDKSPCD